MAGFPIGYPVLFGLAGAAWVLASDGSNRKAAQFGGVGVLVGIGLGVLKMSAGDVSGLGRVRNPQPRARVFTTSRDDEHTHTVSIPRRFLR